MKTAIWLSTLLIAIAGTAISDTSCPQSGCVCTGSINTKNQNHRTAQCNLMPNGHIDNSITVIKVKTTINNLTKDIMPESGLNEFDLSECSITSIESGAFDGYIKLKKLFLSKNSIAEILPDTFGINSPIQHLYLDANEIVNLEEDIFENLANLLELHLQSNKIKYMPNKLPPKLQRLDLSYNEITSVTTFFYQDNLKYLDLCGNPLQELPESESSPTNLNSLCLGDAGLTLTTHTVVTLPKISNFTLVAEPSAEATISGETQSAIGNMHNLEQLSIAHYRLESLEFLHSLTELNTLKLQHITVDKEILVDTAFVNLHFLNVLDLETSPVLVKAILSSTQAMYNLTKIEYLRLRNNKLKHIQLFQQPDKSYFKLDITNNPLQCDCELAKLQEMIGPDLKHHFPKPEQTVCETPLEASGHPVDEYIQTLNCTTNSHPFTADTPVPPTEPQDEHLTLYVILGVVLALLVITGVVLAIIYRTYKQRNQISPCEEENPPQTFQQLQQATSADMLLDK